MLNLLINNIKIKKTILASYFIISFKLVKIPGVYIVILNRITLDFFKIAYYTNVLLLENKLNDL